ncbi:MAG: M1 family metallopeptidase [Bacteroidota bacterium]
MRSLIIILFISFFCINFSLAQRTYWQQRADYKIDVELNTEIHQYTGKQTIKYTNNSPDELNKAYFHLYFNAFQPGSMMDLRSRNIEDPDRRVRDRISKLSEEEQGYLHVKNLKVDGKKATIEEEGTILIVTLPKPIQVGKTVEFTLDFEGQVPLQIRRSGRDNKEGIDYSMSQWYPKLSEYDYQGWNPNPYIGREFHGIWGDFNVNITIPSEYTVAGTGYLQNADEIGHGYQDGDKEVEHKKGSKLTWEFEAPNVIDFMWAADPDYTHTKIDTGLGTTLHFFYQSDTLVENWEKLPEITSNAFKYVNENFGKYPYKQYSVIQGGDGGMEYPMATLITGHRNMKSLIGVTVHEMVHSWYQMMLATNESLYAWMDEGFTSFAENETTKFLNHPDSSYNAHSGEYRGYRRLALSGKEEPLTTHSDHYNTNFAYGLGAYIKGCVFLKQLEYVIGEEAFKKGMLEYFDQWSFKHPTPNDFIKVMEEVSGMELHWYTEMWVGTTKTIDYEVGNVIGVGEKTFITLVREGEGIAPIDIELTFNDGSKEMLYAPLRIMRGEKETEAELLPDWPWTYPEYTFEVSRPASEIKSVEIDPSGRLADVDLSNNKMELEKYTKPTFD